MQRVVLLHLFMYCISSPFIYIQQYLQNKIFVLTLMPILKQQFIRYINGEYQTN